jgi:pyruvate formate lyase activating enzyme
MPAELIKEAIVFDIERYATKDGPGIRTVVFLKGCNLRCLWCQNPESQSAIPQIMYYGTECNGCGRCIEICPRSAITRNPRLGFITDHEKCDLCGLCVDACFRNARHMIGQYMSVDNLFEQILKDKSFFDNSGGGVTFSGGEPLLHSDFVSALARKCKDAGIHTIVETAGLVPLDALKSVADLVDLVYFDFKHIDEEEHKRTVGASPKQIKENLKWISNHPVKLIVRIPIIPKVNNNKDTIRRMFHFLKEETSVREVELLAFHRLGLGKYDGLGMDYVMRDVENLEDSACEDLACYGREMGLTVYTGISKV